MPNDTSASALRLRASMIRNASIQLHDRAASTEEKVEESWIEEGGYCVRERASGWSAAPNLLTSTRTL